MTILFTVSRPFHIYAKKAAKRAYAISFGWISVMLVYDYNTLFFNSSKDRDKYRKFLNEQNEVRNNE